MAVEIEKLEGLERKIILSLSWAEINQAVKSKLQETQKKVRMDGFRPGKAPYKIVENMYGQSIQNDVLNDAAVRAFYEQVAKEKLEIAGLKKLDVLSEEEKDKEYLKVAAVFEVMPEDIKIDDLSKKEVVKIVTDVTDKDVDKTLDILRKQRVKYETVKTAAKNENKVVIDFTGKIDGEPFEGGSAENYSFVLGENKMLPEFEKGVLGLKPGQAKDVEVKFPEDYHGKEVAGKTAVFTIQLKEVLKAILPEIDDNFAISLGIENGDIKKMREEIKENLTREVSRRVETVNKDAVINMLLNTADFVVPGVMVNQEIARLKEKTIKQLQSQGGGQNKLPELADDMFKDQAEKSVKIGLILNKLVTNESLLATDDQVKVVIEDIAHNYENPDEVKRYYQHNKQEYANAQSVATEKNIVDFVLNKVKVKEDKKSFDDLMKV